MCKRNFPDKNKAKTKFLATLKKEKKKKKPAWDV